MGDLCTACLCSDRNLYFIGETGYYHIYTQILNEIPVYDLSQLSIRVCWECHALLRRLDAFKHQVKRSYTQLMNCYHQGNVAKNFISCRPHLQVQQIHNISLPPNEIKTELEHVKTEMDVEHCEPETFVNNITLVSDMVDNSLTLKSSQQGDVKPEKPEKQKSKKKLKKHKLRKTKMKNKRRVSVQSLNDVGGDDYKSDLDSNIEDYKKNEVNKPEENNSEAKTGLEETKPDEQDSQEMMGLEETMKPEMKITLNGEVKRPRQPPSKEILPEKPECAECGKKFSSRKTYRYHLNVLHKGQNRYPCPRCGKVYQWKSNLGRHIRTHKARDSGELYCDTCDKRFASVATYRQHLRVSRRHVPESEFSFMCNDCGKKFVNKTRLRDHIDWDHLNKIKFRCQLCNKPFKCHTSLYVHMQNVHRNKEKKDNLCHVCGKSYQNAAKLKYHIVAMHTSETPYQCEQCNAAFGWYSSLYRHVREVHYKMKVQPKKSKKAKKNEVLPSLLPPQIILSAIHQPGPP